MRTTVIGLGTMGQALAHRLLAGGQEVTVWNRSNGKAGDLVAAGAVEASSVAAAVETAEVVFAVLADDAAVRAVLLPAVPGPATVVNCTTGSVAATVDLVAAYPDRFVAAPVFGAPAAVTAGSAVYAVGGPPAVVARIDEALAALSDRRLDCGAEPANATKAKLVSNSLLLSGLVVLAEAVATAQAAGLDPALVRALFGSSAMVAPGIGNRLDDMIDGDHDDGWFAMPLGAKDLELFVGLATAAGLEPRMARQARDAYRAAAAAGGAGLDVAGVIDVFRGR